MSQCIRFLGTLFLISLPEIVVSDITALRDVKFTQDYNKNEMPPSHDGKPLMVNVSLNLRNIFEVNEKAQYITLETSLRMYWKDERIQGVPIGGNDFVNVNGKEIDNFWIPDVFIDQAKALRVPNFYVKPSTIRVYADGTLRYSSRVNYDVACGMDFHRFPVDEQKCEIKYESFGYTTRQMIFQWHHVNNINPNITLDQFEETVIFQKEYATDYYEIQYPGLILNIILNRKVNYHLINSYIPSCLFVTVAWLSLFVNPEAIPGRISMVMMTLLTLMAMFSGIRQSTPKVSYVSMLDIWMVMCIFFIFLVLIEFAVVTSLIRRHQKPTAEKIEDFGTYGLPILFGTFNVIYWFTLFFT